MEGINKSEEVQTTALFSEKNKKIRPIRVIVSEEGEIRSTNFTGINKWSGKAYTSPQLVFLKNTPSKKQIDVSFNFKHVDQIISSLQNIKSQNLEYFEAEWVNTTEIFFRYNFTFHFCYKWK